MKYLLLLIASFMLLCTNSLNSPIKTTLDVYAGDDITVTKNDTVNFSGIYTSNADIEIFNWYILSDKINNTRSLLSQTHKLQYMAPDSACTLSFIFQAKTVSNVVDEDTVIVYVIPDTTLTVNAGQDQTVLADFPVLLHATYTGGNIINTYWKVGSDNFIPASPETTITAPETPLLLQCIFRVATSDNRVAADTVNINVISLDSLRVVAAAGNDTSVEAGSQMTLHGAYKGKNITNTFWKIGNSDFTPAPLDTTITLPDTPSIITCVLKVTNVYQETLDTVKIKVLSNTPLSALAFKDTTIQAGSPLKIHGSYTGNVHTTYWKIGSGPFAQFSPETTITVPDTAMSLICILKVQDFKLNEAVDTAIVTVIDTNAVYAQVGNDTTVDIGSSLKLSGSYTGNVVATYWKIGASIFIPASPETTIIVPSTPLVVPCIFKVVGAKSKSDEDTLYINIIISDTTTAKASAGRDTIVPVNSRVKLDGSYAGTNVAKTFWNINNSGFVSSPPDSIIQAPSSPAVWMCIFKTVTNGQKTDQDTMYLTTVTTTVQADAGDDQHVAPGSTVQLSGAGKDTVNQNNAIVKYEWKYGDSSWIESADGKGIFNPSASESIICSLRITAMDSQTATDFCIIHILFSSDMVLIQSKGKTFLMGNRDNDPASPVHQVSFTKNFFMSKTEITQKEYVSKVNINPSFIVKNDNYPVMNCNWYDAVFYCNAKSKYENRDTVYSYTSIGGTIGYGCHMKNVKIDYTKKGYRLPTESEWEFACRAGTTTDFYWGNSVDGRYLWYIDNSGSISLGPIEWSKPGPVGKKLPNAYELYDMSGNVREWCNDRFASYTAEDKVDPTGPPDDHESLQHRVVRNGSFEERATKSTSFFRSKLLPKKISTKTGFRIVLEQ